MALLSRWVSQGQDDDLAQARRAARLVDRRAARLARRQTIAPLPPVPPASQGMGSLRPLRPDQASPTPTPQSFASRSSTDRVASAPKSPDQTQRLVRFPTARTPSRVATLPAAPPQPWLVRAAGVAQRGALGMAIVAVVGAASVYGLLVRSQQAWSQEYARFESLQRQERDLMLTTEALKDHLARQSATPDSSMQPPSPENTLFLERPPQSLVPPEDRPTAATVRPRSPGWERDRPIGY